MSQDCLICFEAITEKDKTVTCGGCMTIIHAKCWREWKKTKNHKHLPCIYCQQFDMLVYYKPPSSFQKFWKKCLDFFS